MFTLKKTTAIVSAAIMTFALSACSTKMSVKITDEASGTFSYTQTLPAEMMSQTLGVDAEELEESLLSELQLSDEDLPQGTSFDVTTENGDLSITATQEFAYSEEGIQLPTSKTMDDFTQETGGFNVVRDGNDVTVTIGGVGDETMSMLEDEGLSAPQDDMYGSPDDMSMLMAFMDFEISVTFPGEVKSASHDGVIEGNTVTWDVSPMTLTGDDPLIANGTLKSFDAITVLLIIFGVIVVGLIIWAFTSRVLKGISDEQDDTPQIYEGEKTEPVVFLPEDEVKDNGKSESSDEAVENTESELLNNEASSTDEDSRISDDVQESKRDKD